LSCAQKQKESGQKVPAEPLKQRPEEMTYFFLGVITSLPKCVSPLKAQMLL
jgi:hypothetical protein